MNMFKALLLLAIIEYSQMTAFGAELKIVQVAPLSGFEATQGRAYASCMQLHFNAVNKSGGVNGHTVALVTADDEGRPELTVKLTDELILQHKPIGLAGYFGSENIANLIRSGSLDRERLPLIGYRQSDFFHEAPYLFSTRAMLDDEIRKIAEHLGTLGIKRLGVVYEEAGNSQRLIAYAEQVATSNGLSITAKASYRAGTVRTGSAAEHMAKESPQAILLVAAGGAAASFIEQFRAAGGTSQIFATSSADIEQLAKRLGEEQMQGVIIAQVTPNPYKVTSRIGKELNDLFAQAGTGGPTVSYACMEGFITAKVIVAALRRLGNVPTRDGFIKALESSNYIDLGGYAIRFGPDKRAGSRLVELTIITAGGRIRQ